MADIITRQGKGEPLQIEEGDSNFTNLNTELIAATNRGQQLLSGLGKKRVGKSIMWLGDSITAATTAIGIVARGEAYYLLFPSYTNLNVNGNFIRSTRPIGTCPTGNGTLRYYSATTSMTWQAAGDAEGALVPIPTSGFYVLESGAANHSMLVAIIQRSKPSSNAADTVNVTGERYVASNQACVGFAGWAELELGCPFSTSLNYGISSITAADWVAATAQWDSIYTDLTSIHIGTNDITSRATAVQCLLDVEYMIQKRQALGSVCFLWTLLPYDARSAAANQAVAEFNQGIHRLGAAYNCDVADVWQYVANPDTSVTWASGMSADGLHPGARAGHIMAKYGALPILQKYVQPRYVHTPTAPLYHATNAPYGNLCPYGNLIGTGGTASTGVTGTVPTGWTAARITGSVMAITATAPDAGSPIARTDGKLGNWSRFVCNNTGGVNGERFELRLSSFMSASDFVAGDFVVFEGEVKLSGTGIQNIFVYAGSQGAKRYTYGIYGTPISGADVSDINGDTVYLPFRSAPIKIMAGDTNFNIYFAIQMLTGGIATFDIGQSVNLHKIPA